MIKRPGRPFSIADGMILIAAIAVSFLILRAYFPAFIGRVRGVVLEGPAGQRGWSFWYMWAVGPPSCLVVPLMLGLVAMALCPPRPRLSRLARRPGFAVCAAASAALIPGLVMGWARSKDPFHGHPQNFDIIWGEVLTWFSHAGVGAWLALIVGRRWRADPHWIDRTGRVLGCYCVADAFGYTVINGVAELIGLFN